METLDEMVQHAGACVDAARNVRDSVGVEEGMQTGVVTIG